MFSKIPQRNGDFGILAKPVGPRNEFHEDGRKDLQGSCSPEERASSKVSKQVSRVQCIIFQLYLGPGFRAACGKLLCSSRYSPPGKGAWVLARGSRVSKVVSADGFETVSFAQFARVVFGGGRKPNGDLELRNGFRGVLGGVPE